MTSIGMSNNSTDEDDYLDQLTGLIPWDRSLTALERTLIIFIVLTFVTLVGSTLLCLACPQSPLRRRYDEKRRRSKFICDICVVCAKSMIMFSSIKIKNNIVRTMAYPERAYSLFHHRQVMSRL
jgi:hypothetical protein